MKSRFMVAALGLALASLTGCDPRQTGAAVIVGSDRLSERNLQASADETFATAGTKGAVDPKVVLNAAVARFVTRELLTRVARKQDVTVTQTQVDQLITAQRTDLPALQRALAQQAYVPPSEFRAYVKDVLLESALEKKVLPDGAQDAQRQALLKVLGAEAKGVHISVSPRYGSIDPGTLSILPAPDDLSSPAPVASASSSALPSASQ